MKGLISSCIRQNPEILREFLESLDRLDKPKGYSYFFILSDLEKESRVMLNDWSHGKPVETLTMNYESEYITDEDTHHWNSDLVSNVTEMKNIILDKATDYDYLLFVDSDTYLHPKTLTQLLGREKDIITEISWTKWYADDDRVLPNAWWYQKYGFPEDGLKRLRNEPLVKVGGFGGLYLISRKALQSGVSFNRLDDKPEDWGEDRHFAVRAKELGFDLWCDTTIPSFHIYRMSDLPRLKKWKNGYTETTTSGTGLQVINCAWGTQREKDSTEFREIVEEIEKYDYIHPHWSRDWEYPWSFLNADLYSDSRVIDVGVGRSPFSLFLLQHCAEVHCVDKEKITLPPRDGLLFKQADMINLPYPDNSFDAAFNISVLEHAELSPITYVKELLRVLKVGGILHLTIDVNRGTAPWKFKEQEIERLCNWLGADVPPKPVDLLRSEDHHEGKVVGEGLSVLGFTIKKTSHVNTVETSPKLVAMMLTYNDENRYLERGLDDLSQYVDEIVILDGGSTDKTLDICRQYPKVILHQTEKTMIFGVDDEFLVREQMYRHALERNPDWILVIDSDQIMEERFKKAVRALITDTSKDWYSFCLCDMWNEKQYRVDGAWSPDSSNRAWRHLFRVKPDESPEYIKIKEHCGDAPAYVINAPTSTGLETDLRIKHYAYATEEGRRKKQEHHKDGEYAWHVNTALDTPTLKDWGETTTSIMTPHNGVLVSIPNTGQIKTELMAAVLNIVKRKPQGIGVDLPQGMPVDSNRNNAVKRFLASRFEWLLFLDSDIVPPVNVIERLLSHGKRVVSAVCWSSMGGEKGGDWEHDSMPYPTVMKKAGEGKGWHVDREGLGSPNGLISVDAVGMACILIHREVFERMGSNWYRLNYDDGGICDGGEDFSWCLKAKNLGYEIYVDKSVQCSHYKTVDLKQFNDLLAKTVNEGSHGR